MINYKAVGRRISQCRKKKDLTQAALSEMLNVSESYMSQVEKGVAKVSLGRLSSIADALGIDIAYLVSDHIITTNPEINTEIIEIIKDWSEKDIHFLTEILICASEQLKCYRKE